MRQFDTAWRLASYHLDGLADEECRWRPASRGLHVEQGSDGRWRGQMPDHEGYDLGPPSIAWLTWHIGYWWSMALDHSFGDGRLSWEKVLWPGSADGAREWIFGLEREWRAKVDGLPDDELVSTARTRWPFRDRPFGDVIAWVNLELTKNASEIGYVRFLHAARGSSTAEPSG